MRTLGSVDGKTIVEIGPGDAVGLGILFLEAGARRYIAIDRFQARIFGSRAEKLYQLLASTNQRSRSRISYHAVAIEDIEIAQHEKADVIISFDVLSVLRDPLAAIDKMAQLLKPQGTMVHHVNYGPVGIWGDCQENYQFLFVSDWLWNLMGSNRGYPNRVRHVEIDRRLSALGFAMISRVCDTFEVTDLRISRSRMLQRYQAYSDDELLPWVVEFGCSRDAIPALGAQYRGDVPQ